MNAKKTVCILICALLTAFSGGCGSDEKTAAAPTDAQAEESSASADVDLTQLSSTMVYSEVYNMVNTPADYEGKTVKAKGSFSYFQDESTGNEYYAVIISDATACCTQGLEFILGGGKTYPDDYPEPDKEITVMGEFETYDENGTQYCHLINAEIV